MMDERLRMLPAPLDKTAKSITQVKDKRRHHDPHKLAFLVVDLLLYLLFTRNKLKDTTLTKAPTTPDPLSGNKALFRESVDRLHMDPQKRGYLNGSDDLFQPLKLLKTGSSSL